MKNKDSSTVRIVLPEMESIKTGNITRSDFETLRKESERVKKERGGEWEEELHMDRYTAMSIYQFDKPDDEAHPQLKVGGIPCVVHMKKQDEPYRFELRITKKDDEAG